MAIGIVTHTEIFKALYRAHSEIEAVKKGRKFRQWQPGTTKQMVEEWYDEGPCTIWTEGLEIFSDQLLASCASQSRQLRFHFVVSLTASDLLNRSKILQLMNEVLTVYPVNLGYVGKYVLEVRREPWNDTLLSRRLKTLGSLFPPAIFERL